jgi:tRNA1Val (adenine37-N6)-methyltransferase
MMHAVGLLKPEGRVCVIIPTNQLARWISSARAAGLSAGRICHVFTLADKDPTRVMIEFYKGEIAEPRMESILIERSPGEFSEAYKALTHEFYTRW